MLEGYFLWNVEQIAHTLEKRYPASTILPSHYCYIVGGYVFQGYREGLNRFGQINNVGDPIRLP